MKKVLEQIEAASFWESKEPEMSSFDTEPGQKKEPEVKPSAVFAFEYLMRQLGVSSPIPTIEEKGESRAVSSKTVTPASSHPISTTSINRPRIDVLD